jgi:hypothetical protein
VDAFFFLRLFFFFGCSSSSSLFFGSLGDFDYLLAVLGEISIMFCECGGANFGPMIFLGFFTGLFGACEFVESCDLRGG